MAKKEHVALTKCYFCNESSDILLATRYNHHGEPVHDLAPLHGKVVSMNPCSKCEGYMKQGVILITIDDAKSGPGWNKDKMPNPHRTGGWFVVRDEAVKRMMPDELAQWALKYRWMFIEHEAADKLGLFSVQSALGMSGVEKPE